MQVQNLTKEKPRGYGLHAEKIHALQGSNLTLA